MHRRNAAEAIEVALADTPVVLLQGARQVGKTTLVHAMLESFLAMEILKQRGWSRLKPAIHHSRTSAGAEVDLVLKDRAGRVVVFKTKSARTVGADAFRGRRALRELVGKYFVRGVVLHDGSETVPLDPALTAVPHSVVWADA